VQVIITDQGIADLRGKSPHERAELIANNCAHPDFRDALHRYITLGKSGQTPQSLAKAFAFHQQLHADRRHARGPFRFWRLP
jgi:acyl-CoA hydrolase